MSDDKQASIKTAPLRWMHENLLLVSSIARFEDHSVRLSQSYHVDQQGRLLPHPGDPEVQGRIVDWHCSSPSGLLCCSYLEAMGKIISPDIGNQARFVEAANRLLANDLPQDDAEVLWREYRNAWSHQCIVWGVGFARSEDTSLWLNVDHKGRVLNISRLVDLILLAIRRLDAILTQRFPVQLIRELRVLEALSSQGRSA